MVSSAPSSSSSTITVAPARCAASHAGPSGSLPLQSGSLNFDNTTTHNAGEECLPDSGYGSHASTATSSGGSEEAGVELRLSKSKTINYFPSGLSEDDISGIVRLEYEDGSWDLRGLTAGHAAIACLEEDSPEDATISSGDAGDGDDGDDFSTYAGSSCSDSDADDTFMAELGNTESTPNLLRGRGDPWALKNPRVLGKAHLADSILSGLKGEPVEEGSFFDWALIPLPVYKINQLPAAAGGIKRGRLVPAPSRILISPGSLFVTAYMVEVLGQGSLSDGDSGTWVISEGNLDLIGHIVATDVLGAGYIIPAQDIFNDIVTNGLATAVWLPTAHDIHCKNTEIRDAVHTLESTKRHGESGKGKQVGKDQMATHIERTHVAAPKEETLDYDSDDSVEELKRTRIGHGKQGLHSLTITSGSRRFQRVLAGIATRGSSYSARTFADIRPFGKMCEFTFQFSDTDSAWEALKVLRRLLADVENGRNVSEDVDATRRKGGAYPWDRMEPVIPQALPHKTSVARLKDIHATRALRGLESVDRHRDHPRSSGFPAQ
ncbi:hypothetical protein V2A60_000843 [Cordyceps javanica]